MFDMFSTFILAGQLFLSAPVMDEERNCPFPELYFKRENKELTELDVLNMKTAQKRCPELYGPKYCLVRFIMKEEQAYVAICGER